MAVPTVASAAWFASVGSGTTYALPFPATVAPNDLIVVLGGYDGDPGTVTAPAGWTVSKSAAGEAAGTLVMLYSCDGTEDGGTFTVTFATGQALGARILQVKGATLSTTLVGAGSTGTSATPDPPVLTPAAGADTYLWLSVVAADGAPTHVSYPTNLPDLRDTVQVLAAAEGVRVSVAGWLAGGSQTTLNPAVFTNGTSTFWRGRTLVIAPGVVPVSSYTWVQLAGSMSVQFADTSTQSPTSWLWTFGDGKPNATTKNPTHVYDLAGTYTVTLTATNHMGAGSTSSRTITVKLPSGQPQLTCTVRGEDMSEVLHAASWESGRESWFDTLQPGTATLHMRGRIAPALNDQVRLGVVGTADPLWIGYVTDVDQADDPVEGWSTTVRCTDVIGRLGQAEDRTYTIPAGTLATQVTAIMAYAGLPVTVQVRPSAIALPSLVASTQRGGLLAYIDQAERASNAVLAVNRHGTLDVLVRAGLPAGSPDIKPVTLSGRDSPSAWARRLSSRNVVNLWGMSWPDGSGAASGYWQATDTPSITAYGVHAYTVDLSPTIRGTTAPTNPSPIPFPAGLRTVMAVPRWAADGAIPIFDSAQQAIWLEAFEWVQYQGELWQVLRVEHDAERYRWTVALSADVSQNIIGNIPEPPIDPENKVTVTLNSPAKDTQIRWNGTAGSGYAGSGQGTELAVGYHNGFRFKSLIDFALTFPVDAIRCLKATLYLTTSSEVQVNFGAHPQLIVRRVTESWNEGAFVADDPDNATVWPGPHTTTNGQVTANIPTGRGVETSIDVTDLVHDALIAGELFGFRLHSSNEDSPTRTTEFRSGEYSTAVDPRLVATFEVSPVPTARPADT